MDETGFFSNISQETVTFGDFKSKSPLFVRDANIMGGYFLANFDEVRKQLPSSFSPVRLPRNKAIVGIFCIDYLDSDIGPYKELSVSIAIHPTSGVLPGVIKSATSLLQREFHSYILHLPVNTEISVTGGREIFNYPKTLTDIDIRDTGTHRIFTIRDPNDLSMIVEIECTNIKTDHHPQNKKLSELTMYTYLDQTNISRRGVFKVNQIEKGKSYLWPSISLRYGDHKIAKEIKKLGIGKQLLTLFNPHCEGILSLEE